MVDGDWVTVSLESPASGAWPVLDDDAQVLRALEHDLIDRRQVAAGSFGRARCARDLAGLQKRYSEMARDLNGLLETETLIQAADGDRSWVAVLKDARAGLAVQAEVGVEALWTAHVAAATLRASVCDRAATMFHDTLCAHVDVARAAVGVALSHLEGGVESAGCAHACLGVAVANTVVVLDVIESNTNESHEAATEVRHRLDAATDDLEVLLSTATTTATTRRIGGGAEGSDSTGPAAIRVVKVLRDALALADEQIEHVTVATALGPLARAQTLAVQLGAAVERDAVVELTAQLGTLLMTSFEAVASPGHLAELKDLAAALRALDLQIIRDFGPETLWSLRRVARRIHVTMGEVATRCVSFCASLEARTVMAQLARLAQAMPVVGHLEAAILPYGLAAITEEAVVAHLPAVVHDDYLAPARNRLKKSMRAVERGTKTAVANAAACLADAARACVALHRQRLLSFAALSQRRTCAALHARLGALADGDDFGSSASDSAAVEGGGRIKEGGVGDEVTRLGLELIQVCVCVCSVCGRGRGGGEVGVVVAWLGWTLCWI